jgi:ZIP family zinc transporter
MTIGLLGLAAGFVGTGIGASLAFLRSDWTIRKIALILEFCAGFMTSICCFDLLPQAIKMSGLPLCVISFLIGVFFCILAEDYINQKITNPNDGLMSSGLAIMLGVAIHNFPEGLAIGSGFEASFSLGMSLVLVIGLHDLPEGLSMALPIKLAGGKPFKTIFLSAMTGVPMFFGAIIGGYAGGISPFAVGTCLSIAGGVMLYISCGDIMPQSNHMYTGKMTGIGYVIGFLLGMTLSMAV